MGNVLITGGAGFIGSHVVRRFVLSHPEHHTICLDSLTYAGNLSNLSDIARCPGYSFIKADICDPKAVSRVLKDFNIDGIIHLAAESHVDRSIEDPLKFASTNVMGTLNLLQTARTQWKDSPEGYEGKMFLHISTDEVYGALGLSDDPFTESSPYAPHSPYSASKASSDHFVRAYHDTYGLPTAVTHCSNNYGPYQFPEKLIPLVIMNIADSKPLPVYGTGKNIRDWLYVEDHARAIDAVFHRGRKGATYNIGGLNQWSNIDLVRKIIGITDRLLGNPEGHSLHLIRYVTDRPGHDLRYAIDSSRLRDELGWEPEVGFDEGLETTVRWYLSNRKWIEDIRTGAYRNSI